MDIEELREENRQMREEMAELKRILALIAGEVTLLKQNAAQKKKKTFESIAGKVNGQIVKYIQTFIDGKMNSDPEYWDFTKRIDQSPNKERFQEEDMVEAKHFVIALSGVSEADIEGTNIVKQEFNKKIQNRFHYYKGDKESKQKASRRRDRKKKLHEKRSVIAGKVIDEDFSHRENNARKAMKRAFDSPLYMSDVETDDEQSSTERQKKFVRKSPSYRTPELQFVFNKVHRSVVDAEVSNRNGKSTNSIHREEIVDKDVPIVEGIELEAWMIRDF
ncbi:hypothetical protein K501DRAFT_280321 [Backusella circina FSU 941]|nr:hypothetical protein K501DRAFT_280321 [Backusella circina FSU 941]